MKVFLPTTGIGVSANYIAALLFFALPAFVPWGDCWGQEEIICHTEYMPPFLSQVNAKIANTSGVDDGCCITHLKISINFIQLADGTGNYTPTGHDFPSLAAHPPFVDNPGGYNFFIVDECYSGYDFSRDIVEGMNYILANNQPRNLCNGWMYYTDPTHPFYDPTFEMPEPASPTGIRLAVNEVRFVPTDDDVFQSDMGYVIPALNDYSQEINGVYTIDLIYV